MHLSDRLEMLASMVKLGGRLADIGTDHAYLPIALLQRGQISSAIAMDVRVGPLARAQAHIEEAGLSAYIETRLSDGLEALDPGEADVILIAGMGGPLMNRILSRHPEQARSARELILQPQSEIGLTRAYLAAEGYEIVQEEMVCEDGKYYPMMRTVPGKTYRMSALEQAFGPLLLQMRHPVLRDYMEKEEKKCRELLKKLEEVDNPRTACRRAQVEEELKLIQEGIKQSI